MGLLLKVVCKKLCKTFGGLMQNYYLCIGFIKYNSVCELLMF